MTNTGNTTTAFNVNLFLTNAQVPAGFKFSARCCTRCIQTPVAQGCDLKFQTQNVLVREHPDLGVRRSVDDAAAAAPRNDPSITNPTLWRRAAHRRKGAHAAHRRIPIRIVR